MTAGVYICTVFRDRPSELRWLLGPKRVDTSKTTLDLDDTSSLDAALISGARRHHGGRDGEPDLDLYSLTVTGTAGELLEGWRFNPWRGDPAGYAYDVG